jgi:hypothetical protein
MRIARAPRRFNASDTTYAKAAKPLSNAERQDMLEKEARAAGFAYQTQNVWEVSAALQLYSYCSRVVWTVLGRETLF